MRLSQFAITTTKETPSDADVVSHQLMLRAGYIRKLGSRPLHLDADRACACCARSRTSCARR